MCKDLVEALPDPQKLETLADWLDLDDVNLRREGQDEVQQDLRVWAVRARAALANHRECDALEALRAIMDCDIRSIPDEVWAKAREVVEEAK